MGGFGPARSTEAHSAGVGTAPRIVVAGAHPTLVEALSARLHEAGADVVGMTGDLDATRRRLVDASAEVCILEDSLVEGSLLAATTRLRREAPGAKLILLETLSPRTAEDAFLRGMVEAVVHRSSGLGALQEAVVRVLRGELVPMLQLPTRAFPAQRSTPTNSLSHREEEVLALVVRGYSNAGIAEELGISVNTVRTHVQNLLRKLGVDRRSQAIPRRGAGVALSRSPGSSRAPVNGSVRPDGRPVAVVLVGSHRAFADALTVELGARLPAPTTPSASTVDEACALLATDECAAVVLHQEGSEDDGLEAVRTLSSCDVATLALVPAKHGQTGLVVEELEAGAQGWISADMTLDATVGAVAAVQRGGVHLSPPLLGSVLRQLMATAARHTHDPHFVDSLTRREVEIIRYLMTGMSQREVGERLFLSVNTVHSHVQRLMRRADCHSTLSLVAFAWQCGLQPIEHERPAARQIPVQSRGSARVSR